MNKLRTLGMLAALGAATAALAQAPAPAGTVGATERASENQPAADTKPKDKLVGLPVETSDGQQLGSVVDIVRTKAGTPAYAVIAIDTDTSAVPYEMAVGMIHGDKVIMNQAKLTGAPKVKQSEWLDQTSSSWRTQSDRYWSGTRTASEGAKKPADR